MKKIRLKTDQNHPAIKEFVAAVEKGMKDQTSQEWEKSFDKLRVNFAIQFELYPAVYKDYTDGIKNFISNLLAKEKETARREERERVLKLIEKNKIDIFKLVNPNNSGAGNIYPDMVDLPMRNATNKAEGFNQALDFVSEALTNPSKSKEEPK